MRICVIGAGIIGSSIAYELSKHASVEVSVVDASYPGWGATAASFCWANANAKEPVPYFELNAAGLSEYDRLAAELATDDWLNRTGCLVTTPNDEEAVLRVDRARSLGYAAELVSSDDVMSTIEPALNLRKGRKVAYFPTEIWIDTTALLGMLLEAASERGALCHFGRAVSGIQRQSDGTFVVELNDTTALHADVVINAAGNGADKIAHFLDRRLVLAPTLGITMRVRSEQFALRTIVRNLSVDARPDGPNLFRLHAATIDDRIARGGQDRNLIAAEMMRRADELFHGFDDAVVIDTRIAPRPNVEDGLSWIGPVEGIDGYYETVTHSGVTLAPLVSRLLAEEVTAGRRSPLLESFRPDRPTPVSACRPVTTMREDNQMTPERSAVVLIDLQNFQAGRALGPRSAASVVEKANALIEAGRRAGSLIVYVRSSHLASGGDALKVVADNRPAGHGGKLDGWDDLLPELIAPRPEEDPITIKRGWDAFYGSSLELQLRRHGVDSIVLSGISTNFGVEGTARSAVDRGFNVLFAEDAMSSADDALHHFAVTRIFPRIGRVLSTGQAVARLDDQVQLAV